MATVQTVEPRELRISMRVDSERKAVIARAAYIRHTTISDFVLENAYDAAREIIAEETQIRMTKEQFEYMCQILDAPPAENLKKMRKLLTSKTVLD
jgi:uncharacterized protein (DUF1778 family)